MYQYSDNDKKLLQERNQQFKRQTDRYFKGELSEEEYLPLRLQNGLYVQRHAPMLRIAIPYGLLSSKQVRKLAEITRKYDKGYAHVTTRQNLQLNWPEIKDVPAILSELATVEMHAIQTSGNCIRNVTADQFAGAAKDELEDPRPYCELIRQWSTFHPEFAFLPRKFKIAVCGSQRDRAATLFHDIGVFIVENDKGQTGFRIHAGGGLGRTPVVAPAIKDFLEKKHLLSYLDAILRVYNQLGRRDNKYKSRIKILVRALGAKAFSQKVEDEWQEIKDGPMQLPETAITDYKTYFKPIDYQDCADFDLTQTVSANPNFTNWYKQNVNAHKVSGYSIVTLAIKQTGRAPGDLSDVELDAIADLADQYSHSEIRSTHKQNLVFAQVKKTDLFDLWQKLKQLGFADPSIETLRDIICCPGGEFCSLANAKSIPLAEDIQRKFDNLDYLYDVGELELNISGCMNACGHHHVGHIGILGVDKKGKEFYQVSIGGSNDNNAKIGKILGPAFNEEEIADVVEKLIAVYLQQRHEGERFIDTVRRIQLDPFKGAVYDKKAH